jgi:hypothetical protein
VSPVANPAPADAVGSRFSLNLPTLSYPMRNIYYLAALALTLTSCDALNKPTIQGTYRHINKRGFFTDFNWMQFTGTKCIIPFFLGNDMATEYSIEEGYVYVGMKGSQIRFKIVSPDTLQNESTLGFEGTYVKVGK